MPRSSKSKASAKGIAASARGQARASSVGKRVPTKRSARVRKASRRYGGMG
jgi:hypothetical protein